MKQEYEVKRRSSSKMCYSEMQPVKYDENERVGMSPKSKTSSKDLQAIKGKYKKYTKKHPRRHPQKNPSKLDSMVDSRNDSKIVDNKNDSKVVDSKNDSKIADNRNDPKPEFKSRIRLDRGKFAEDFDHGFVEVIERKDRNKNCDVRFTGRTAAWIGKSNAFILNNQSDETDEQNEYTSHSVDREPIQRYTDQVQAKTPQRTTPLVPHSSPDLLGSSDPQRGRSASGCLSERNLVKGRISEQSMMSNRGEKKILSSTNSTTEDMDLSGSRHRFAFPVRSQMSRGAGAGLIRAYGEGNLYGPDLRTSVWPKTRGNFYEVQKGLDQVRRRLAKSNLKSTGSGDKISKSRSTVPFSTVGSLLNDRSGANNEQENSDGSRSTAKNYFVLENQCSSKDGSTGDMNDPTLEDFPGKSRRKTVKNEEEVEPYQKSEDEFERLYQRYAPLDRKNNLGLNRRTSRSSKLGSNPNLRNNPSNPGVSSLMKDLKYNQSNNHSIPIDQKFNPDESQSFLRGSRDSNDDSMLSKSDTVALQAFNRTMPSKRSHASKAEQEGYNILAREVMSGNSDCNYIQDDKAKQTACDFSAHYKLSFGDHEEMFSGVSSLRTGLFTSDDNKLDEFSSVGGNTKIELDTRRRLSDTNRRKLDAALKKLERRETRLGTTALKNTISRDDLSGLAENTREEAERRGRLVERAHQKLNEDLGKFSAPVLDDADEKRERNRKAFKDWAQQKRLQQQQRGEQQSLFREQLGVDFLKQRVSQERRLFDNELRSEITVSVKKMLPPARRRRICIPEYLS